MNALILQIMQGIVTDVIQTHDIRSASQECGGGGGRGELTAVGPQHVNHSPWRAHNDLGSSLQLSNLEATMEQ